MRHSVSTPRLLSWHWLCFIHTLQTTMTVLRPHVMRNTCINLSCMMLIATGRATKQCLSGNTRTLAFPKRIYFSLCHYLWNSTQRVHTTVQLCNGIVHLSNWFPFTMALDGYTFVLNEYTYSELASPMTFCDGVHIAQLNQPNVICEL